MPNLAKVLKEEISRIARKETKRAVVPLRKPATSARHVLAELKRRLDALEKACRALQASQGAAAAAPAAADEGKPRGWISGKGVRSLRQKLGVSQEAFAKLVGVTANAVYQWERKAGALRLRHKTREQVFAVRHLGAREAKVRLAEIEAKKPAAKKPAAKAPRKAAKPAAK